MSKSSASSAFSAFAGNIEAAFAGLIPGAIVPATTGKTNMSEVQILRSVSEIAAADNATLLATYNALTGKQTKKFASREAAQRQVETAMMAAKDADGHLGVPKGQDGEVKTFAELVEKAADRGQAAPTVADDESDAPASPVFPFGSMADQLQKSAAAKSVIVPREKKAPAAPGAARVVASHVMAMPSVGTSTVRSTSQRGAILQYILTSRNSDGDRTPVAITSLDDHFQQNTKGYVQKLCEAVHVFMCDADGVALTK